MYVKPRAGKMRTKRARVNNHIAICAEHETSSKTQYIIYNFHISIVVFCIL